MTDTIENTQEAKSTPTPQYKVGDSVTVSRGKTRGQRGTVAGVDAVNGKYAITFADGTFDLVKFVSVKAPVEDTVTAAEIAAILTDCVDMDDVVAAFTDRFGDAFAERYTN